MEKHLIRNCEGFNIINNEYQVKLLDTFGEVVSDIEAVTLYSSRFKLITAMSNCFSESYESCKVLYFHLKYAIKLDFMAQWFENHSKSFILQQRQQSKQCLLSD